MSIDLPLLTEDIFKVIFEKSPGSLLVKADAPQFTILAASDAYLAVTACTRENIIGKGFFEAFPENKTDRADETAARNVFTKVTETGRKIDVPSYRFDVCKPGGKGKEIHYWSCSNTPIIGNDNKVTCILNTIIDITGEVKAKDLAIENESRLRMAADAAALATWDLGLNDQSFSCSPRMAEIFGHPATKKMKLKNLRSQVNAEDMENIVVKAYYEAIISGNYLYEVRIYWPDGSLHWIKTQGIVLYDDEGQPERMLGTILDITESKRDEIRKNDFIAMASHELKTPLTSLKAYIQLLTKRVAKSDDSFANNALTKANNQINKMTDLIHGFLDLSRLESGKLQVKMEKFDINKLIEDVIAETNTVNYSHVINFTAEGAIIVDADREKIGQVLSNFLSNAIKYSSKDTIITVQCKTVNDNIRVAVRDEGIGIKPKDQEKLFQRFYRVENEQAKNVSGFGIGLYLAQEIIQRHKGKIWVVSEEDRGSTFYFSLPL
jgi:two-component system sensor histidine kinase VicK